MVVLLTYVLISVSLVVAIWAFFFAFNHLAYVVMALFTSIVALVDWLGQIRRTR